MEGIEELRKQYYESIMLLENEYDIICLLPSVEYENFFPLIDGIMNLLNEELNKMYSELICIQENDLDMKEYIEEEIKILKFKLKICNNLLEKANKDLEIEKDAENNEKKHIIFATSEIGNVCLLNDLKTISEEYYSDVLELLNKLQNGYEENNVEKGKKFTSTDKRLNGVHELKEFKIRLFYKNLASDVVYVLLTSMKKADHDKLLQEEIALRTSNRQKQYERLKKELENPDRKQELIKEHQEHLENLSNFIKENKR